ncbi:MAG TPA: HAD family hydrolase [Vicinamibacterales bacterium]|nr:HAD family hydrolase [Vicinamibacterales bacterium]
MPSAIPRGLLLDLDDTILDDSSTIAECWRQACEAHRDQCAGLDSGVLYHVIRETGEWFWADAERHRRGRLDLDAARREVVGLALARLGVDKPELAAKIAGVYGREREAGMQPLPDAIDTVRRLREAGCRLALLTNGAGAAQRRKIVRFGLSDLFDAILVEGEVGYGKPDERIYRLALEALAVDPQDAWMAGDNLEWDVAAPQKIGLFAVWIDGTGKGLPPSSGVRPDRIVRTLSELMK